MELDVAHAVLLGPDEGEPLTGEDRELRVKVSRPELDVLEFEVGPGYEGPGPHFHKEHVDSFYVLEGELEFRLGDDTVRAGAGAFVSAPPRAVHAFTNPGPGRARFLNVHAPDRGFTEYLRARDRGEDVDPERYDIWETAASDGAAAVVLGPGDGEALPGENRELRVKVSRAELDVVEFDCGTGFGTGPHTHDDHVDSFYALEGELEFRLGDETVRAGDGTFVAAPPSVVHGFTNPGPGRARVLNIHAPAAGFIDSLRKR